MITEAYFVLSLFCLWFKCEIGGQPPFLSLDGENQKKLLSAITGRKDQSLDRSGRGRSMDNDISGPVVYTKSGAVEGYVIHNSEGRAIYTFTGIPYGEAPVGHLRFRDPVPKKPWRGNLKATSDSPCCLQASAGAAGNLIGQEDCLYLDVHTPNLPKSSKDKKGSGFPVIIASAGGGHFAGRASFYGGAPLLREDVIFVSINVRIGALGFLATGDEASPGNWGLKDQALSVQWVHDNIAAFGGDPDRIVVTGISTAASNAHLMLFINHKARDYITGIFGISGTALIEGALDSKGRVIEASNIIAKEAGCPTTAAGRSHAMVECLRKVHPYMLIPYQTAAYMEFLPFSKMLGPVVEPNVTNALITELPETMYERGVVPPIPLILTREEDELGLVMEMIKIANIVPAIIKLNWPRWAPTVFKLGYRTTQLGEQVTEEQAQASLRKLTNVYFGREMPSPFAWKDSRNLGKLLTDMLYNAPLWKSLELHNKVGPTYSYIQRHRTFIKLNRLVSSLDKTFLHKYLDKTIHAMDFPLLFNNSRNLPPLKPGTDIYIASNNLCNMVVNFAKYGKPLYRTPSGELLPLWTTIGDVNHMRVLDVGLVHNISMVIDPLPSTMRKKIWEQVKF